ncbi:serine/arginine repetitive matrix protein 1 [Meriones unguiculatus]|uniref:serine/arginine repetitive matrix protein 1 n=1 Tax=Meriones unguiculatus TaxID=10047 RepID=UPI00293E2AB6|nr:serine/arginine repetitive matrix protein 1 [Meriones unguiculatus]
MEGKEEKREQSKSAERMNLLLSEDPNLSEGSRRCSKGLETGALKSLSSRDAQWPAGVSALSFCQGSGPTPPGPFPTAVHGGAVRTAGHQRRVDSSVAARIESFSSPRGEARGAEEGRLPTWGLTPAARQRRLHPGAIKPVHPSAAEQQRLPVRRSHRQPAPAARRPSAVSRQSRVLLKLSRSSDPRRLRCARRPPLPGAAALASAAAPGERPLSGSAPRTELGAPSCGPRTLHPSTAPGPELRAPSASPSRARNFGSPAALREEAAPDPHRRAQRERASRTSLGGCKETDLGPRARTSTPPPPLGEKNLSPPAGPTPALPLRNKTWLRRRSGEREGVRAERRRHSGRQPMDQ